MIGQCEIPCYKIDVSELNFPMEFYCPFFYLLPVWDSLSFNLNLCNRMLVVINHLLVVIQHILRAICSRCRQYTTLQINLCAKST